MQAQTVSGDADFSANRRLSEKRDFDHVFADARRSADRFFTVLYRGNGLGYPRLGLVVAKKNIPHAVGRNRIKRLTRESFRQATPLPGAVDVIVLARGAAAAADNKVLFASLAGHWRRLAGNAAGR